MSGSLQDSMKALVQKHDGYTSEASAFSLEAMTPYVELADIAVPQPQEGQVLVRVALASVNPSDVMFIKGMYGQPRRKGWPAGFEGVGEVVVSGGGATGDNLVGRRVSFTAVGQNGGTWAQYAVADAAGCIPLIDAVRDEDGAGMIVNPLTALAMFSIVRDEGEKAFVLTAGASQLCKLMIGAARAEGFRPVAIVRRAEQVPLLLEAGAAHVLNEKDADFDKRLGEILREEKPRVLLDAVAGPVSARIFELMPRKARWIIYGRLDERAPTINEPGQLIFMGKRIEGFWLTQWMRSADPQQRLAVVMQAQKNFAEGLWATDVTARLTLEEAMEHLPEELAKPNGKVFIKPGH